jgi:hypothetical protein
VISPLNDWRVVQRLHCRPEDYARVIEYVRAHVR